VLWITPLRALAHDTAAAMREPIDDLNLDWTVELRTGDTPSHARQRQKRRPPDAMVTTPESLSVLLSYADASRLLGRLDTVIVDEWHELIGTKRGVQTELGLARLRRFAPGLRVWGLSATLGNLEQARDTLLGAAPPSADRERRADQSPDHPPGRLIQGQAHKAIVVDTLRPATIERFPWAGHMGVKLIEEVSRAVDQARTSLLFTNTRSQAELWHHHLIRHRPDLLEQVALHHGSLEKKTRLAIEDRIREGSLRAVVCTSSLDLGVDFSPVDQVLQLGSPKGVARLMQRAGRSGHQPGAVSRVIGVPTHAFELIEFSAAREAVDQRGVEARPPLKCPFDLLVQHLVTVGAGGGFREDQMLAEVRSTHAYRELTDPQWDWAMTFLTRGGQALYAYPEYRRLTEQDGRFVVSSAQIARRHRMQIGTITSDPGVTVAYRHGRTLGSVEERFIARMRPGDTFLFAGRLLELVRVRAMRAEVRQARARRGATSRWGGTRFPLSTQLASRVLRRFEQARRGVFPDGDMRAVRPILELQQQRSELPQRHVLLIENTQSRDGAHALLYPFAGRLVHEGLGALLAFRLARDSPRTFSVNCNDYGVELLCDQPLELHENDWRRALAVDRLLEDLLECLNASELARRAFREIARVAGLVQTGFPGEQRTMRQLQASSDLFFDVFNDFDRDNLLLDQARREVLEQQLEFTRLHDVLERLAGLDIHIVPTQRFSPLAFPLVADRLREQQLSSEKWEAQVQRMIDRLERDADSDASAQT